MNRQIDMWTYFQNTEKQTNRHVDIFSKYRKQTYRYVDIFSKDRKQTYRYVDVSEQTEKRQIYIGYKSINRKIDRYIWMYVNKQNNRQTEQTENDQIAHNVNCTVYRLE